MSKDIGLRIKELREGKKLTQIEFSERIGIKQANLSHIENKGEKISIDVINKIISNFDINIEWLFTGKGEKQRKEVTQASKTANKVIEEETRPRVPYSAAAGSLSVAMDGVTANQCEQMPIIKAFARYDFTILAHGDSMLPEYHSGDELACLHIKNSSFIQWGRCHVLDTAQGIIVKRIFEDGEFIRCVSDNEYYKAFNIHKSEVYNIALVIGMLRRY